MSGGDGFEERAGGRGSAPSAGAAGDPERYREKARDGYGGRCERCGARVDWADIEVHHVDRDRRNDRMDNLERICKPCHYTEHHDDSMPLWGLVVSVPPPVLEAIDRAVEERRYASRSEAVNRAVASAFGGDEAAESVSAWFSGDSHAGMVQDRLVEGRGGAQSREP